MLRFQALVLALIISSTCGATENSGETSGDDNMIVTLPKKTGSQRSMGQIKASCDEDATNFRNKVMADDEKEKETWVRLAGTVDPMLLKIQAIVARDDDAEDCKGRKPAAKSNRRYFICTGSTIHQRVILTSASCVEEVTTNQHNLQAEIVAVVGLDKESTLQVIRVIRYVVHYGYNADPYAEDHDESNVALLLLECRILPENFHRVSVTDDSTMALCKDSVCGIADYYYDIQSRAEIVVTEIKYPRRSQVHGTGNDYRQRTRPLQLNFAAGNCSTSDFDEVSVHATDRNEKSEIAAAKQVVECPPLGAAIITSGPTQVGLISETCDPRQPSVSWKYTSLSEFKTWIDVTIRELTLQHTYYYDNRIHKSLRATEMADVDYKMADLSADGHKKMAAGKNYHHKMAASNDYRDKMAAGDDHLNKMAPGNDYHAEMAAGNNYHAKMAAGNNYHAEMAAGDDNQDKVASSNDYHDKMAAGSDYRDKMAAGNDYEDKMAAGRDYQYEIPPSRGNRDGMMLNTGRVKKMAVDEHYKMAPTADERHEMVAPIDKHCKIARGDRRKLMDLREKHIRRRMNNFGNGNDERWLEGYIVEDWWRKYSKTIERADNAVNIRSSNASAQLSVTPFKDSRQ